MPPAPRRPPRRASPASGRPHAAGVRDGPRIAAPASRFRCSWGHDGREARNVTGHSLPFRHVMQGKAHPGPFSEEMKMQFVLLIYQGTTPLPGTDQLERASAEEQKRVYEEYGELNKAPGITPGLPLGFAEGREDRAREERERAGQRRTIRRCARRRGWVFHPGGRRSRRCRQAGFADPGGASWRRDRGAAGGEVLVEASRAAPLAAANLI